MSDNIVQLTELLGETAKATKELYAAYQEGRNEEMLLRKALSLKLKEMGLLSAKTPFYTAAISVRKQIAVVDEQTASEWIQEQQLETEQYFGLKLTPFKSMAMAYLKDTGEVIPGTEIVEQESIAIKEVKGKRG